MSLMNQYVWYWTGDKLTSWQRTRLNWRCPCFRWHCYTNNNHFADDRDDRFWFHTEAVNEWLVVQRVWSTSTDCIVDLSADVLGWSPHHRTKVNPPWKTWGSVAIWVHMSTTSPDFRCSRWTETSRGNRNFHRRKLSYFSPYKCIQY